MEERLRAVAEFWTPKNVNEIHHKNNLTGVAYVKEGIMIAPHPTTRRRLAVYLHECAHFELHTKKKHPRYIEEYQAWKWAIEVMRASEIKVCAKVLLDAQLGVKYAIEKAIRRGVKRIDTNARKFAKLPYKYCKQMQETYQ
jgi:hypothetical protein